VKIIAKPITKLKLADIMDVSDTDIYANLYKSIIVIKTAIDIMIE